MRATRTVLPAAVAVGAVGAWPFVEPHLPVLRHATVPVLEPGAEPVRVLHLSDLHLLPRSRRRARWVRGLARLVPDLVVSTGDHWSSEHAADLVVDSLASLTSRGAVGVFVPGNNDYFSPQWPSPLEYLKGGSRVEHRQEDLPWAALAGRLSNAGWLDLTQRREALSLAGVALLLTGTDDAHLRRDRYDELTGPVPDGTLGIGVAHTPARRLLRAFGKDGYRLVLAGHTHGGQLRVPFAGPLVTNCDLPRDRARGLTLGSGDDGSTWLHVSAGLGTSPYLPVRVACRPEATLLELVPSGTVR